MNGWTGLRVAVAIGALGVGLSFAVTSAYGSDTFVLKNQSQSASLIGTSLWGRGNTMPAGCRTGPFPGQTETAFTFKPGNVGSITLTRNPFSDCPPAINPLIDNDIQGPGVSSGTWVWIPVDPVVGDAYLTCDVLSEHGSDADIVAVTDGKTCTFADANSTTAGRFSSSAAPIRKGKAVAYVHHYAGTKHGQHGRGRYAVVIRNMHGHVLGREEKTLSLGRSQRIHVPVTRSIRRRVAKHGSVRARAIIKRIDGKRGHGDHTTLRIIKDSKRVPF